MIVEIANVSVPYGAANAGMQTNEERIRRLHRLGYITDAQTAFLSRHSYQTQITEGFENHCLDVHIYLKNPAPRTVTAAKLLFS